MFIEWKLVYKKFVIETWKKHFINDDIVCEIINYFKPNLSSLLGY